jgi:hypothetical protein
MPETDKRRRRDEIAYFLHKMEGSSNVNQGVEVAKEGQGRNGKPEVVLNLLPEEQTKKTSQAWDAEIATA